MTCEKPLSVVSTSTGTRIHDGIATSAPLPLVSDPVRKHQCTSSSSPSAWALLCAAASAWA
eukprot:CAMPEP_0205905132 /NCGR_PEP_ID=MMETSP1325-20131115/1169_1 /ASSEMBLY_ACC=CAM_ASM_000708 /TAXON_ID=236786 /ORGANISM="Florenciella sp., Strain RCC1007" /LENGTH=60 /DNA_ID=CAMNT_0053271015 /DNA_START=48 /DNA_END=230 /DNA_ORIENTATION=+